MFPQGVISTTELGDLWDDGREEKAVSGIGLALTQLYGTLLWSECGQQGVVAGAVVGSVPLTGRQAPREGDGETAECRRQALQVTGAHTCVGGELGVSMMIDESPGNPSQIGL